MGEPPEVLMRVGLVPDSVVETVAGLEALFEQSLPGSRALARVHGRTDLDDLLSAGSRAVIRGARAPRRRGRITPRWGLADVARKSESGSISAEWSTGYGPGHASWQTHINWFDDQPDSPSGRYVDVRMKIRGRTDEFVRQPDARDDLAGVLAHTMRAFPAAYGYVTVSTFPDDPRAAVNSCGFFDGLDGALGYSWMVWLPPATALRIGDRPSSPNVDVIDVGEPINRGRLVVASIPPCYMDDDDLRSYRDFLTPALLPPNLEAPLRRRTDLARPAGILADDWIDGAPDR
ncbi:MAG: hypothetical protein CL424_07050 [Acidimicrobiaceae bacterium]|nr:hypothetical protein [Acidimicrobiaceae bacterium]